MTYSYFIEKGALPGPDGKPQAKAIKHAHFNEAWIREGDREPVGR